MYASLTEDSKKVFMNEVLSAAMGSDYSKDTDFKALYDNTYFPCLLYTSDAADD